MSAPKYDSFEWINRNYGCTFAKGSFVRVGNQLGGTPMNAPVLEKECFDAPPAVRAGHDAGVDRGADA
jgi:hypothetical protein